MFNLANAMLEKAPGRGNALAVRQTRQNVAADWSFSAIDEAASSLAALVPQHVESQSSGRWGVLAVPNSEFVISLLALWRLNQCAVPLSPLHSGAEWQHVLRETQCDGILALNATAEDLARIQSVFVGPVISKIEGPKNGGRLTKTTDEAIVLFTSGTTGKPKGVSLSHGQLWSQIERVNRSWEIDHRDRIVHALPLHHTHGLVNALLACLAGGASVILLDRFEPAAVWQVFAEQQPTLFMGVPTMYERLIKYWDAQSQHDQQRLSAAAKAMRLMVSGSAALSPRTFENWRKVANHILLERYGMTEFGMALSNPLHGERRVGTVGTPMLGAEMKIVDSDSSQNKDLRTGELFIRSTSLFHGYLNHPSESSQLFVDGWFATGDVAELDDKGYARILGRKNRDIIKSAGYKISALEIEQALLNHDLVEDACVVAIADDDLGELIAAAVVARNNAVLEGDILRSWLGNHLAPYKVPRRWIFVSQLPRNVMGKLDKTAVAGLFTA